jgi:hypothetical protein
MFENRELKRVLEFKREGIIGSGRKLHYEELRNYSSSPNIL